MTNSSQMVVVITDGCPKGSSLHLKQNRTGQSTSTSLALSFRMVLIYTLLDQNLHILSPSWRQFECTHTLGLCEILMIRTLHSTMHFRLHHTVCEPPLFYLQTCKFHCSSSQRKQRICCLPESSTRNLNTIDKPNAKSWILLKLRDLSAKSSNYLAYFFIIPLYGMNN